MSRQRATSSRMHAGARRRRRTRCGRGGAAAGTTAPGRNAPSAVGEDAGQDDEAGDPGVEDVLGQGLAERGRRDGRAGPATGVAAMAKSASAAVQHTPGSGPSGRQCRDATAGDSAARSSRAASTSHDAAAMTSRRRTRSGRTGSQSRIIVPPPSQPHGEVQQPGDVDARRAWRRRPGRAGSRDGGPPRRRDSAEPHRPPAARRRRPPRWPGSTSGSDRPGSWSST